MEPIYFDNNATTRMLPDVAAAIQEALRAGYANPSSQHQSGQRARRAIEDTRERITNLLGGQTSGMTPDRLIFTSGGTESNNLAVRGLVAASDNTNVVISSIEHPSVSESAQWLRQVGIDVRILPVDRSGVVDMARLRDIIDERTQLVSVMLGNHETGVLQPVAQIVEIAHDRGACVHCDAVQAVGKIEVDFRSLGVDAMSVSAHKMHGPVGIGGLLLRHEATPNPILTGGYQQQGIRPGTESVALSIGFLAALEAWSTKSADDKQLVSRLRDLFETRLQAEIPSILINGVDADRLPHVSNIAFPGLNRQAIVLALDMAGVACSTGSACASGSSEPSPVLMAMGLDQASIEGSIRISLSRLTTSDDIEQAVVRIIRVFNNLSRS